jgi:glucose/mannose-6-phosphate isomerase
MLDDPAATAGVDAQHMLATIGRTGDMLVAGWQAAGGIAVPLEAPAAVVVCGLGGSAIGGDLLAALLAPSSPAPVICVRDDALPAFVGPRTLVLACSYSGDTAETLAAYEAARQAGARIVVVTSGGRLASLARDDGGGLALVPSGMQPRAALPLLIAPMLRVAGNCGLTAIDEHQIRAAAGHLTDLAARWGPGKPAVDNPAKALAIGLQGTIPIVYASTPRLAPAARRWKTQLNENSKVLAATDVFPELLHNEIVGWESVRGGEPALHVAVLREPGEDLQARRRIEAARAHGLARARAITDVWARGDAFLDRILSLVLFGDLVSAYLAILSGIDPTPVEPIARIKAALRP